MSVCEQSFHFSQTAKVGMPPQSQTQFSMGSVAGGAGGILGGINMNMVGKFADLDDAKTLSQADGSI